MSQPSFILLLVPVSLRDPGSVSLSISAHSDCLMHLGLWHLLSLLAGSHPSVLCVCSKCHLSVSCVTISPQLRGSASGKHLHISPLKVNLASISCYLSSYKHACGTCSLKTFENIVHFIHVFISCVQQGKVRSEYSSTPMACCMSFVWLCTPYLVDGRLSLFDSLRQMTSMFGSPSKRVSLFDYPCEMLQHASRDVYSFSM